MADKHSWTAAGLALADETTVKTQLVGGRDTDTKDRRLTIDGDAPCPNPILDLTTRRQPRAR
jgi:hypothetical protein